MTRVNLLFKCVLLGIPVVIIICYLSALSNDFVNWDDYKYVVDNDAIKQFNVKKIFSIYIVSNYHPLTLLSFATEYHFFKLDPSYYHLTNMVLHILNSLSISLIEYLTSLALIGLIIYFIFSKRQYRKDIILGLLFFFITLFPVLKLVPFGKE